MSCTCLRLEVFEPDVADPESLDVLGSRAPRDSTSSEYADILLPLEVQDWDTLDADAARSSTANFKSVTCIQSI